MRWQASTGVSLLAALPEILAGIRLGMIRAAKGGIIGQLLVSAVGFRRISEADQSSFLMEHLRALLLILFAFAADALFSPSKKRVEYYAAART